MNVQENTIFVAGYPKSGLTWLTRLLADALDSPAGGSVPAEDRKEPASEGWDRPGKWVVRKGHYLPVYLPVNLVTPEPHRLNLLAMREERVVFIHRDPRDVAVSAAAYHRNRNLSEVLTGMIEGRLYGLPSWGEYTRRWRRIFHPLNFASTTYDRLLNGPATEVFNILSSLDIEFNPAFLSRAEHRQSIQVRRQDIMRHGEKLNGGRELNLRLLRNGRSGEWKKKMSHLQKKIARKHWGKIMRKLGYEI